MRSYSLEVSKDFDVPAEVIYDAWLDPSSVKEWMCPGEGVHVPSPKINAQVGGRFEFDMDIANDTILPHRGSTRSSHNRARYNKIRSSPSVLRP